MKLIAVSVLNLCLFVNIATAQEAPRRASLLDGVKTANLHAISQLPDAKLIYVDGLTDTKGYVVCDQAIQSKNWHYRFYSAAADKIITVHSCGDQVNGITTYLKDIGEQVSTKEISGRVLDSNNVVDALSKNKNLPVKYPKRAQLFVSLGYFDENVLEKDIPYFLVTYVANEKLYVSQDKKIITSEDIKAKKQEDAPKRFVRKELKDTPRRYRKVVPHAALIAEYGDGVREIFGYVDATGDTVCTDPDKDGMRYYLDGGGYIKSCKTKLGETKKWDTKLNDNMPFTWNFIDTDELMFTLLEVDNACPVQKADPSYKYNVALRKFTPDNTPIADNYFLWEIKCGDLSHYYPALDAKADTGSMPFRTEKAKTVVVKGQTKKQAQVSKAPAKLNKKSYFDGEDKKSSGGAEQLQGGSAGGAGDLQIAQEAIDSLKNIPAVPANK